MSPTRNGSSSGAGLALSKVSIENWRNFSKAEVPLERRVFLVGPNASGKSNFLDVFRFLLDVAAVGGGLQAAVAKRGGVSRLRALSARRHSDIGISVQISSSEDKCHWEYRLRFNQDKQRRALIKEEEVLQAGKIVLQRPDREDKADPERLTQTHLEQVNVNREFREIANFFASLRYLHIVPQLVRDPDRSVGRQNDPFGGDFLEQIARTQTRTRESRLRKIRGALRVAVPQLTELELSRDKRGTPHLRGKYEHWRPRGAWQEEDQFSDGTLRLMGILWAVLDGSGPLLLEEPEMSLHSEVVRFLPQMFARVQSRKGRQIFVSTHSKELLEDDGIGLDEVLLLLPSEEGTTASLANEIQNVAKLLEGGLSLSEIVSPKTSPKKACQLTLSGS